jgi:pSer/pThr/pTyr-binding forkhead associated (FHA) protein
MKAKLFCKTGILSGIKHEIARTATIGKDVSNDIVIDAKIVSGRHARLFFDEQEKSYFLEDLRSRNGTKLDGLLITEKEKLGDLHVITLANKLDFIFQVVDEAPTAKTEKRTQPPPSTVRQDQTEKTRVDKNAFQAPPTIRATKAPAAPTAIGRTIIAGEVMPTPEFRPPEKEAAKSPPRADTQKTMVGGPAVAMPRFDETSRAKDRPSVEKRADDKTMLGSTPPPVPDFQMEKEFRPDQRTKITRATFFLEIKRAGQEPQTFELKEGENIVGRLAECALCIDDPSLSRRHAAVIVRAGKVLVKDLNSKNRTFVGNKEIAGDEVEIKLDAGLRFGAVEAQLIYKKSK